MPEHEAIVEISTTGATFKISGSEKFVEKMIEILPSAFPATIPGEGEPVDLAGDGQKNADGKTHETIDDYVARIGITNSTPEARKVAAFIFYLTEIAKHSSCSTSQIEECFDVTGLKTPENLRQVINNAGKAQNGGYVRSVSRGQYGVTTNGKNLVKQMAKGS